MYTIIVNDDVAISDDNAATQPLIDFAIVVGRDSCFTGSIVCHYRLFCDA